MTKTKFIEMLEQHDWHFERSDDHSKWRQGMEERKRIMSAKIILGAVGVLLYEEHRKKHHA
jgi:hypothetical protein